MSTMLSPDACALRLRVVGMWNGAGGERRDERCVAKKKAKNPKKSLPKFASGHRHLMQTGSPIELPALVCRGKL
jgi:hypothetical protein